MPRPRTLFRGDFYSTDRGTEHVKEAKAAREAARRCADPQLARLLRASMRIEAREAVHCARRYRAARTSA